MPPATLVGRTASSTGPVRATGCGVELDDLGRAGVGRTTTTQDAHPVPVSSDAVTGFVPIHRIQRRSPVPGSGADPAMRYDVVFSFFSETIDPS